MKSDELFYTLIALIGLVFFMLWFWLAPQHAWVGLLFFFLGGAFRLLMELINEGRDSHG